MKIFGIAFLKKLNFESLKHITEIFPQMQSYFVFDGKNEFKDYLELRLNNKGNIHIFLFILNFKMQQEEGRINQYFEPMAGF